MRQLDREAIVEINPTIPHCWCVVAQGPSPAFGPDAAYPNSIIAQFHTPATDATDGFTAKALAIEYARMKFSKVTVKD